MEAVTLDVRNTYQMEQMRALLARFSLCMEPLDLAVGIYEKDVLIACGGKMKNICKCFAVDKGYQQLGITNTLMTALQYAIFQEGYASSFVFTKPMHRTLFENLHFAYIMATDDVCLLEKGFSGIKEHIKVTEAYNELLCTKNGAVVMNANPFTNGHLYLVEQAAKQVERLLVLVVEEDASVFPFADRFQLVQAGTAHLPNVLVLPSSRYVISQATFPNYFLRDADHAFLSYATLDAVIFAQYFAPGWNIKTRFVGEEPLDIMTQKYNTVLSSVLPDYDVCVQIVPRLQVHAKVISASAVRKAMKNGRLVDIQALVPPTTYTYLQEATDCVQKLKDYDLPH